MEVHSRSVIFFSLLAGFELNDDVCTVAQDSRNAESVIAMSGHHSLAENEGLNNSDDCDPTARLCRVPMAVNGTAVGVAMPDEEFGSKETTEMR